MSGDKILGALLGAAVGDAMGAATETKSTEQIAALFGGYVTSFQNPPEDTFARGRKKGQITDAASIPYLVLEHLLREDGKVSKELGEEVLKEWGTTQWFEPFAGMTTRKVVNGLSENGEMSTWAYAGHLGNKLFKGHYYALSSNGAACKAYPLGLLNPGDADGAIKDAIELTLSSHDDPFSISGACAVAAAVSEAVREDTSVFNIIDKGIYGAKRGEELARMRSDVLDYPGPSVSKRIEMAVEIAVKPSENTAETLRKYIGSGPAISETLPTAFGLIIAHNGQTMEAIHSGVNIGDETSAISEIIGAICGAYRGVASLPLDYLPLIEKENEIDLQGQSRRLQELLSKRA